MVKEQHLIDALKNSAEQTVVLFAMVPLEKENYRYASEKWTVKQVLRHVIDCQRVYTYRAMRFSRMDETELPGFEEYRYAMNDNTENTTLAQLAKEYAALRTVTIYLFEGMNDAMLDFKGKANNRPSTARIWGWMAAGHNIHHCQVVKDKYL